MEEPLRIFVAMPGTDMGADARYTEPQVIKDNLLDPVVEKLRNELNRAVVLSIEKDKTTPGVIHQSMFSEARDADVYIADLTGANPNVYLELGVRWALRDNVTIMIAQRREDLLFNVVPNRAIFYGPDIIQRAVQDIVTAVVRGLHASEPDSPVRVNGDYITVRREDWQHLSEDNYRLSAARGEDLVTAARHTDNLRDRIRLLDQALETNPAYVDAHLEKGRALRNLGDYPQAVSAMNTALGLAGDRADIHRELGLTLSKLGDLPEAVKHLRRATELVPSDAEAWSNLGGALRRIGLAEAPVSYDREALLDSRRCYERAQALNQHDHYSGLNVARLNLLLSRWDPDARGSAADQFREQFYLCQFEKTRDAGDYWLMFDLAEATLFSNEGSDALQAFRDAVDSVPDDRLKGVLDTVTGPLEGYIQAEVLTEAMQAQVSEVISFLKSCAKA